MIAFIQDIITRFGGRPSGSAAERDAQYHVADGLRAYCDQVAVEEFEAPMGAHFGALKIFSLAYVLTLVLYWIHAETAAVLGLLNALFFMGHFVTYRHWLDFLFRKQQSYNVIGDIEPQGEAHSTLIIAGHIDSVHEFQWWYRFKQGGIVMTFLASISLLLLGLYTGIGYWMQGNAWQYGWWVFAALAPLQVTLAFMHGKRIVDGAMDNLTGVALAVEMGKVFSQQKLQHTRLRVISFGSEEACLRGAAAYARAHKAQLLQEKAFLLNLDSFKDPDHLTICTSEHNTFVKFAARDIQKLEAAFQAVQVPYLKLPITVGASDASAFKMNGLPAITVIGLDSKRLDPAYHTRLDVVECLNAKALEDMRKVLVAFVQQWDASSQDSN